MSAAEFELIERHFAALGASRRDVVLGVGDDAALLAPPPGHRLAVASASGGAEADAQALARECFARAQQDLLTRGITPAWLTLGLSLEHAREAWLARFAAALHDASREAGVSVIGGDTTAGTDAVTIFLTGFEPA